MLIAEKALRMYTDTSFCDDIHPAFNRLLNPIRSHQKTMEYIREFCRRVYFHRSHEPTRGLRQEFMVVLDAIMQCRRLAVLYQAPGVRSPVPREIEPYVLINNDGDWQVVGYCRQSRRVKTFALARMHKPETVNHAFMIPDSFKPEDYCRHEFERLDGSGNVKVSLEVDAPAAAWVREKLWHRTQRLTELPHGGLRLDMTCALTEALVAWILRMGPGAEVLAPKALRNTVAKRAAAIVQRYAHD
jgi:predicted DNA-binding transcriptional regulator YafY